MNKGRLPRQAIVVLGLALLLGFCSITTARDKKTASSSDEDGADLAKRLAKVTGTGRQTEKIRDPDGYKKLEQEIEKAVRRGAAWLKQQKMFKASPYLDDQYPTIGILALLHAGEFERDPELADRCVDYLLRRPLNTPQGTYATALTAMALGDSDGVGYSQRIFECAQWLVENQGWDKKNKVWGYGDKVPGIGEAKKTKPDLEETAASLEVVRRDLIDKPRDYWDNSCTQFAVLGLHSAAHAGIKIPRQVWERVEKHFHEVQNKDGGWEYRRSRSTGSMTCAGLASLIIARHHLGQAKAMLEPGVVKGLEWLAEHFTVEENPEKTSDQYYYLYGLERVGVLAGTEFFGEHEWYPTGARYLLGQQSPAGFWSSRKSRSTGNNDQYLDTCYAILFLRRATLSFEPKLTVKITRPSAGKWVRGSGEIVAAPRSSPSRPVTGVDFYLDGKKVGTVAKGPFKLPVDFGPEIKTHKIRVVAHNSAGQEAEDEVATPATYKSASLAVFYSGAGLPPELVPTLELLLDCSDSMVHPVQGKEGEPKYKIARRILEQVLDELPDHFQVGFRAFGHRGFLKPEEADPPDDDPRWKIDSNLLIRIGPLDQQNRRQLIKAWINYLKPAGFTPLVYALLEAHKDLSKGWLGPKMVVVVSDGKETCGGKLADVAKTYKKGGDIELEVHVVGFGVPANEEKELKEIVKGAGGKYYDAKSAEQLAGALRQAVKSAYVVLDETGKSEVARGQLNGAALSLPPGQYQVQMLGAKTKPLAIELQEEEKLALILNKNGLQPYKTDITRGPQGQLQDPKTQPKAKPKKKSKN